MPRPLPPIHPHTKAALAGLIAACLAGIVGYPFAVPNDFDQLWVGARAFVRGGDPYATVLAVHVGFGFPLYYPLPAVILAVPLALLPLQCARLLFSVTCGFITGIGLYRHRPGSFALASSCFVASALKGQTTSALTGASLIPPLGFLLAVKPTAGLALWIARPNRLAAALGVAFTLLTVVFWPWWPAAWMAALHGATHFRAPIMRPGGIVLLLALIRWRTSEGRLLAAWACIPHTEALYDLVPLWLSARTTLEGILLSVLSWVALLVLAMMPGLNPAGDPDITWRVVFPLIYLPALGLILGRGRCKGPCRSPQRSRD